jgi:hypothetical protein
MKSKNIDMTRRIAFFLAAALVSLVFVSCGGEPNSSGEDGAGKSEAGLEQQLEDEGEAKEEKMLPELPEVDYGGYTFTFLAHKEGTSGWDWVGEEARELVAEMQDGAEVQNSEPINDAVYQRNSVIKAKYGIEIAMVADTAENTTLKKVVNAGDDTYDAVMIFNNNVPGVVTGNLLMEVSNLP